MPNIFAYFVLFSWPLFAFIIVKKLDVKEAAVVLILLPFLLLPEKVGVDYPLIPPIDKRVIISVSALLVLMWGYKYKGLFDFSDNKWVKYFCISLFLYPIVTLLNNTDIYRIGQTVIPGMGTSDFSGLVFKSMFTYLVPFAIGRSLLSDCTGHRLILKYLVVFGALYALLVLWEIRMSPQLHKQIYGLMQHNFNQQVRSGGFRAMVFLSHGLVVAIMCCFWLIAVAALIRSKDSLLGGPWKLLYPYFFMVLILSKSLGALIIGAGLSIAIMMSRPKRLIQLSAILAVIVLLFPIVRSSSLFPYDSLLESIEVRSEERGQSFKVRLENEERLLERAFLRPAFGWGTWGRNRVYDPDTGEDISITDGFWVIIIGTYGWYGYLTLFGLLCYPLIRLGLWATAGKVKLTYYTAGLACILAANLVDLIPNSSFTGITMLIAGALCGSKSNYMENTSLKS